MRKTHTFVTVLFWISLFNGERLPPRGDNATCGLMDDVRNDVFQLGGSVVGAVLLLVLPEVHFLLKAEGAARTGVGPVAPVFAAVGDEVGALAEGLSTYLTHVGLLACTQTAHSKVNHRSDGSKVPLTHHCISLFHSIGCLVQQTFKELLNLH